MNYAQAVLDLVERVYVINLETRTDRRAEMAEQLARVGLSYASDKVRLVSAVKPEDAGAFPSIGARGCFESHLTVLQLALDEGRNSILIFEDDADFVKDALKDRRDLDTADLETPWDMLYLGYKVMQDRSTSRFPVVPPGQAIVGAHALMMRGDAIARAHASLTSMLSRPGGSSEGGPMHVDGAYSWFRRANPDVETRLARPQLCVQRSSDSDITPSGRLAVRSRIGAVMRKVLGNLR